MQPLADSQRNRLLAVLFVGVLMGALDIAIIGPALPAIQHSFHVGSRALTWVFSIYVLFNLIGTPLMAKLSDRFGRRSVYVLDVGLFAVGSLVVAASPSFAVMLVGRAVQALGAGGIFPVASAVIGDTFPPEKRGGALGIIGAVFGLAFLLGPILGGLLLQLSWHWLFLINLPVAAWLIWQSLRLLPSSKPAEARAFDWAGTFTLSLALASLAFGVSRLSSDHLWASLISAGVLPFLLATLVLLPLFWRVEKRAADPVLRPGLLTSKQVGLASAFAAGAGLSEAALVFLPALAAGALGVSASTASFMLLPVVLALAAGSPLSGHLLDKIGSKVVIQTGVLLSAAGLVLMSQVASHLALYIVAGALIGFGLSALLGAPLRYIILSEAKKGERGAAQGALTVFMSIGQLLGGSLVGAVAASAGGSLGYEKALLIIGIVTGLLFLLAFGLKGHRQEKLTAQPQSRSPATATRHH
jgi:EmrB/QacA subfamily drug resistance transporter